MRDSVQKIPDWLKIQFSIVQAEVSEDSQPACVQVSLKEFCICHMLHHIVAKRWYGRT